VVLIAVSLSDGMTRVPGRRFLNLIRLRFPLSPKPIPIPFIKQFLRQTFNPCCGFFFDVYILKAAIAKTLSGNDNGETPPGKLSTFKSSFVIGDRSESVVTERTGGASSCHQPAGHGILQLVYINQD
jgi:hypothetical protein